jgi:hypothetical protein
LIRGISALDGAIIERAFFILPIGAICFRPSAVELPLTKYIRIKEGADAIASISPLFGSIEMIVPRFVVER